MTLSNAAQVASLGAVAFLEQQLSIPPASTAGVLTGGHTLDASIEQRYQRLMSFGAYIEN